MADPTSVQTSIAQDRAIQPALPGAIRRKICNLRKEAQGMAKRIEGDFDYIVVGAGTAGCIVANRLSADPRKRVLILEAGGKDNWIWFHIPVGYLFAIGNPRSDWMFKTEPEAGLNGRALAYPRGKVIGGCSAINAMISMRGQAQDYDHWRQLGLPGWGPSLTVFNGNDGMEYPMMINDASVSENYVTSLTVHESAHTYFPFMMGINEQYYAWMDEGWANFFDHFLADSLEHKQSPIGGTWGFGADWEVPPMVPSRALDGRSYGYAAYTRPQLAYTQLYDMLGHDKFHQCLTTYMDRWKGKHPGPYEFFNTFNNVSGQNLDWFWKPWFFEFGYPDLKLSVAKMDNATGGPNYTVYIERKGIIPVPIQVEVEYEDGTKDTFHKTADIWKDPSKATQQIALSPGKTPKKVSLGGKTIPEVKPKDNFWPQK